MHFPILFYISANSYHEIKNWNDCYIIFFLCLWLLKLEGIRKAYWFVVALGCDNVDPWNTQHKQTLANHQCHSQNVYTLVFIEENLKRSSRYSYEDYRIENNRWKGQKMGE